MKHFIIILLLISSICVAQKKEDKKDVKPDTTVNFKLSEIDMKNLILIRQQMAELQEAEGKIYKSILWENQIDKSQLVGLKPKENGELEVTYKKKP